jgi:putative PIN family toxin of toxin-antitoxin system
MKVYAVIDTNVIVSAMLTRKAFSATTQVFEAFQSGDIVLLYNEEIVAEYRDVLSRSKFNFPSERVQALLNFIVEEGIPSSRVKSSEFFPDPKDVVFYEVALSKEDAYLVTGNQKHFPQKPIVVTPAEMMEILNRQDTKD